jgi:hypothetical protein
MPYILLIFFIYLYGSGTFQIPLWLALLGGLESEFVHVYTQVFSQCLKNLMKTQLSPALSQELPLQAHQDDPPEGLHPAAATTPVHRFST